MNIKISLDINIITKSFPTLLTLVRFITGVYKDEFGDDCFD